MLISDILTSGAPLQVDLLTALPESSDVNTWERAPFADGTTWSAVPFIDSNNELVIGNLTFGILPRLSSPAVIVAFGIRFQGQTVFVGACSPFYLADGFPCVFKVTFFTYQWTA